MDHSASASSAGVGVMPAPKQQYLDAYEREHTITMRLLRAYPSDKLDLKPHPEGAVGASKKGRVCKASP